MSRASGMNISTIIVVTLISVMIWLWAASETRETQSVRMIAQLVAGEGAEYQLNPDQLTLELELEGPNPALSAAEEELSRPLKFDAAGLNIPIRDNTYPVDMARAVSQHPRLDALGVTVASCTPAFPEVEVVVLERERIPIRVSLPSGVQTESPPIVKPESTTLTIPMSLRAQYQVLFAETNIDSARIEQIQPGQEEQIANVDLRLTDGVGPKINESDEITLSPDQATVTLTPALRSTTTTIKLVPVQIAGIADDLDRYEVTIPEENAFLRDVVIRGNAELIERIEAGELSVIAFLHFTTDDLELGVEQKQIDHFTPSGITVEEVREITVEITPR